MRQFVVCVLLLFTGILFLGNGRASVRSSDACYLPAFADSTVPDFSLPDSAGRMVCFSSYAGKVVLLDFWASWCGPCRREFNALRRLRQQVSDTNLVIISISVDAARTNWLKALREEQLPWLQLHDNRYKYNIANGLFGVRMLPTTFLIDRKGRMRYKDLKGTVLTNVIKGWLE